MMTTQPASLPLHHDLWQQTLGWQPAPNQQQQFQRLYELILAGNRQLNLTRITEPEDFWEKHLWDSLTGVAPWLQSDPAALKVIDIGTGAGFPGFPVAIARPDWSVTLLDATRKKVAFLETVAIGLDLPQVRTLCDRAETLGQHPVDREQFDLALVRAVGPASVCAEYALPLLKVGGTAILYRGQWTEEEAIALKAALRTLGGQLTATTAWFTPLSQSQRHCLTLSKQAPTPQLYPRPVGIPTQKPL